MFLPQRVMKGFIGACAAVLFSSALSAVSAAQVVRFHDAWKYYNGDVSGAQDPAYNDASWATVYLPHPKSLAAVGGAASTGYCWYRKTFSGASLVGKKLFLEFQGGMQTVYVYVNGNLRVTHYGGYDPFALDITNNIVSGSNVVAVRLNNAYDANFPPGRSGPDFRYYGGLYRDVYLYVADSLHITNPLVANIAGGGGVFVTYPVATTSTATVQVRTHVFNERGSAQSCVVTTTILNASGGTAASNSTSATNINAGASNTFTQSLTVSNPNLWGPNSPYLYKVKSQVYSGGGSTLVDTCTTTIGIRRISFSKANGFQINGVRMILRGGNRHQDYPYVGNAAPARLQYADALRMKEYGFNFVRMSHYVESAAFVAGCDKLGIMSQMAVPGWQHGDAGANFTNNSVSVIRNMIRYYRNSPSIIVWETAHNESSDGTAYVQTAQNAVDAEFPGSTDQAYTTGEPTMSCSGDYGSGYAYEVIASSAQHNCRGCIGTTTKPMIFGEYGDWEFGAGANRCSRNTESGMVTLADNHLYSLSQDRAYTALQADAVWSAIDYQSDYNNGVVRSGAIDWARLPKFSAYFYQSQRDPSVTIAGVNSGPMVFIQNWWTSSSPTTVMVFSNCEQVSLYRNGTLVSTNNPVAASGHYTNLEHRPFSFSTSFASGTLRADGLIGGTVRATHSVSTPGAAAGVKVVIDTANLPPLQADGSDLAFIYGSIVDASGTLLPTATNSVTLTVTGGNARLVTSTEGTSVTVTAEAGVATALLRIGTTAPATIIVTGTGTGTPGSDTVVIQGTGIADPFTPAVDRSPIKTFVIRQRGGVLSVELPSAAVQGHSGAKLTLCNAQGRLVGTWNLTKSSTSVNIKSLPHGVYFGQISGGAGRFMQKILW